MSDDQPSSRPLLEAMLNLSRTHREHEQFYASAPRETAVQLQRHARTLQALADRWAIATPSTRSVLSPYEGADDLNSAAAVQLDGVLFLEGEGRPAELTLLIKQLRAHADGFASTGDWMATAMQASWDMARALVDMDDLADVLGERHRIIANDWLAARMSSLAGLLLARAAEMLDSVDLAPDAVRRDLAATRVVPRRLYSAAELIARAADLCSDSAGLVHDNERRWRVFRARVDEVVHGGTPGASPR
jgi:hypothetical protein